MIRYEYLTLVWIKRTNWDEIASIREADSYAAVPEQTWTDEWYIYHPHKSEPEVRPGSILMSELFNEFGRDGWKLVTSDIADSVIVNVAHGWREVGTPIKRVFILIKEVLK